MVIVPLAAGVLTAYDSESPSASTALTATATAPFDVAGGPTVVVAVGFWLAVEVLATLVMVLVLRLVR
mgnify:CR=1 FL=1